MVQHNIAPPALWLTLDYICFWLLDTSGILCMCLHSSWSQQSAVQVVHLGRRVKNTNLNFCNDKVHFNETRILETHLICFKWVGFASCLLSCQGYQFPFSCKNEAYVHCFAKHPAWTSLLRMTIQWPLPCNHKLSQFNGIRIVACQSPRLPSRVGIFQISSALKQKAAESLATSDVYVTINPVKSSGNRCSPSCVVCRTQSQGRKSSNRCQANACNISTTRFFISNSKKAKNIYILLAIRIKRNSVSQNARGDSCMNTSPRAAFCLRSWSFPSWLSWAFWGGKQWCSWQKTPITLHPCYSQSTSTLSSAV